MAFNNFTKKCYIHCSGPRRAQLAKASWHFLNTMEFFVRRAYANIFRKHPLTGCFIAPRDADGSLKLASCYSSFGHCTMPGCVGFGSATRLDGVLTSEGI